MIRLFPRTRTSLLLIVGALALLAVGASRRGWAQAPVATDPPAGEERAAPADGQETERRPAPGTATTETEENREASSGEEDGKKYIRIRRDEDGKPLSLQTPVIRFVPTGENAGVQVELIGAVHVADRSYYRELNELFATYDALLYELVAPENQVPRKGAGGGGGHPVRTLQVAMKSMLELSFQLEEVDYTKKNFVHADMSPAEFSKSMERRGESFLQLYFRMLGQSIAQQSGDPTRNTDLQLLAALFSPNRAGQLKRIMAEQFETMDGQLAVLNGEEGSTLITERNKKALAVLRRELKEGKKRIGIFYGAGHLSDLEQRLVEEFEMKRAEVRWLDAWALAPPNARRNPEKGEDSGENEPSPAPTDGDR